jgi:hypothetical protein
VDWQALVQTYPVAAAVIIFGALGAEPFSASLQDVAPPPSELVIGLFRRFPGLLVQHVSRWGLLLQLGSEQEVRALFHEAAAASVTHHNITAEPWQFRMPIYPYSLALPGEAIVLPHVLYSLLRYSSAGDDIIGTALRDTGLDRLRECVNTYCADPTSLSAIQRDEACSKEVRASAIVLHWLHPHYSGDVGHVASALAALEWGDIPDWFLFVLGECLLLLTGPMDKNATRILGRLFIDNRDRLGRRDNLMRVIAGWRELSNAPVTTADVQATWLEGSGQPGK